MESQAEINFTAFSEHTRIAGGTRLQVALATKRFQAQNHTATILIFDNLTGRQIDFDLRGSEDEITERYKQDAREHDQRKGPGRPKLGVIAREVTLLPRHWEWLAAQPGGTSTVLRRLVEEARKGSVDNGKIRQSRDAAYQFMTALGGNLPHYEEAIRALFAGRYDELKESIADWPVDVRQHIATFI